MLSKESKRSPATALGLQYSLLWPRNASLNWPRAFRLWERGRRRKEILGRIIKKKNGRKLLPKSLKPLGGRM